MSCTQSMVVRSVAVLAFALLPGCGKKADEAKPSAKGEVSNRNFHKEAETAPEWKPKPESASLLTDKSSRIGKFVFKHPKGFVEGEVPAPGGQGAVPPMLKFKGEALADGYVPEITCVANPIASGQAPPLLDDQIVGLRYDINGTNKETKFEEPEVGRIAGASCLRVRWTGVDKKSGANTKGVSYHANSSGVSLRVHFQTGESDATGLDIVETFVLSMVEGPPLPPGGAFKGGKGKAFGPPSGGPPGKAPEAAKEPEAVKEPEAKEPEAKEPEAKEPEAVKEPEAKEPEAKEPETPAAPDGEAPKEPAETPAEPK